MIHRTENQNTNGGRFGQDAIVAKMLKMLYTCVEFTKKSIVNIPHWHT